MVARAPTLLPSRSRALLREAATSSPAPAAAPAPALLSGIAARRRMVGRHLRRVEGAGLGGRELDRMIEQTFASYARYWAESLRLPSLSLEKIAAGMRYEGFEHLERSLAAGGGTIVALPHLGGWEWGGAHLALSGYPMSVVVESLEPREVFEWFVSFRERLGMHVIPTGPAAAGRSSRVLADNGILCLLCDRVTAGVSGVQVEFFGEQTTLPAGPVTLAFRTGATILPAAVYFGRSAREHTGVIRPPVEVRRTGRLRADVEAGTQALATQLEALIRRAPTQWHLMQPNWPSDLL